MPRTAIVAGMVEKGSRGGSFRGGKRREAEGGGVNPGETT